MCDISAMNILVYYRFMIIIMCSHDVHVALGAANVRSVATLVLLISHVLDS